MGNKNSKLRLFEVMGRLDKTFKPSLNEDMLGAEQTTSQPRKSLYMQWQDGERSGEGSFMTGLLKLFQLADNGNKQKLAQAFPDVFSQEDLAYFGIKENLQEWNFDKKKGEDEEEKPKNKTQFNFDKKEGEEETEEHEASETPDEEKKEDGEKKELDEVKPKVPVNMIAKVGGK